MSLKISIITATYNSESTIEDTLKSVLKQTYKDLEHIIVDGNSKDNTMKIVKKYEKKYGGRLKYISEKDKGIYDAMNKGIKMATGDVIGILNSDDVYASDTVLETIANTLKKDKSDGVYADLLYVNEDLSKPVRKWVSGKGKIKNGWLPAHPTLYLKKEIYDKYGLYNLNYRITADYDFMIRINKDEQTNLSYIRKNLVLMRIGGTSSDGIKGYLKNVKEAKMTLKNNGYKFAGLIIFKRIIRTLIQMIGAKFCTSDNI